MRLSSSKLEIININIEEEEPSQTTSKNRFLNRTKRQASKLTNQKRPIFQTQPPPPPQRDQP
jgi:hypothetical protein